MQFGIHCRWSVSWGEIVNVLCNYGLCTSSLCNRRELEATGTSAIFRPPGSARSLGPQRGVNSYAELQGRWRPGRIRSQGSTSTAGKATLAKTRQCRGQSDSSLGGVDEGCHSCQDRRAVRVTPLSFACSPLLPTVLAVTAVLHPLRCFVLGLLISFSSMRMLLRQSDYSSQQKLDCVKAPKIYPEVYHFKNKESFFLLVSHRQFANLQFV